jgi:hypothetical protein
MDHRDITTTAPCAAAPTVPISSGFMPASATADSSVPNVAITKSGTIHRRRTDRAPRVAAHHAHTDAGPGKHRMRTSVGAVCGARHASAVLDGLPTATSTPPSRAVPRPAVFPIVAGTENHVSQTRTRDLGAAGTVGSLIGTAVGAGPGVAAWVALAGGACPIPPLVRGVVTGLPIVATAVIVGGKDGTVLAGGGALLLARLDCTHTVLARPGPTRHQSQPDQAAGPSLGR